MDRLKRPRGLVRYDSLNGLRGNPRRVLRPRIYVYSALLVLGAVVATFAFRKHSDFEANVLRLGGLPYVVEGNRVRNAFEVHVVNKRPTTETFLLEPIEAPGLAFVIPIREVTLDSLANARLPVFVTIDRSAFHGDFAIGVRIRRKNAPTEDALFATAKFVGPAT
jgi:polyferredoxin